MKKIVRYIKLFFEIYFRNRREDKLFSFIRLRSFWPSDDTVDPKKKFLKHLLESVLPHDSIIYLHGVHGRHNASIESLFNRFFKTKYKEFKVYNIWFASENIRPPFNNNFDCTLSWDIDDGIPKNVFLPGWATELGVDLDEAKSIQTKLNNYRVPVISKNKFACVFANNPESMRLTFLNQLKELGEVDCYGWAFKNPVLDKRSLLKHYRFNLCFENDLYPNWITGDKIFDAYLEECIPIWWGIDSENYINEKALVNVSTLGFRKAIELIENIESDINLQKKIKSEPLLNKMFDYDLLQSKLRFYLDA
jgi:hypothetical protein